MQPKTGATILLMATLCGGCMLLPQAPHTPLTAAVVEGDTAPLRARLDAGDDPNAAGGHGFTPLQHAARLGQIDSIRLLIAAGADPDLRVGRNHWPPAMHALHKGRGDAAMLLLELGRPGRHDLDRALMMAAGYGDAESTRALLALGADPDSGGKLMNVVTRAAWGAWDIDYRWQGCGPHTETVRVLKQADPDVALRRNFLGRMATRFIRRHGCTEMMAMLGAS